MYQSETCYDSDLFESEQLEGLLCPIGLGVLKNPVFDQCGHVYCYCCITDWLKKQKVCPINKQPINETQLIKALPIKNMIDNLQLKRCLMNCEWKGKLDQYYSHIEKECPEKLLKCSNQNCNAEIKRKDYQQHVDVECNQRQVQCLHCQQNFIKSEEQVHQHTCEGILIQCQYCKIDIKKSERQNHIQICQEITTQCPIDGCGQEVKRNQLEQHICTMNHIMILQNQIKSLQQQILTQNIQPTNIIPYLDGWKLSHSKKSESREWVSVNSIERIKGPFCLRFDVIKLNRRPNQWRAVIGVSKDRLKDNHLWYRQKNSYVWIFGGFKCSSSAEVYGQECKEESFKGRMYLNSKGELSFQFSDVFLGTAFEIPEDVRQDGLYLVVSFVNEGKIRFTSLEQVN